MRRIPIGLCAAIAAYVVLRVLVLATNFESVALPMFELYPMGTMAELRLRGLDFPLRYFYDNAAGQILMGFATIPVFAVFGSSYLALKLLPALLGLGVLVVVWKLLDAHVSRRAANLAALLIAVGPPTLTKYSLINSGNHFENLFFTSVAIFLAYRWFASAWKTKRGLFAYAFSAGFALFVFLGALIPVGILFGMHAGLRGARKTLADLPVLLAGFALGLAPLFAVNVATSGRGLGFLDAKFGDDSSGRGGDVLERMAEYLGPSLARSGVFESFAGLEREWLAALFLVAVGIAYLASVPGVLTGLGTFARKFFARSPSTAEELRRFEAAQLVPFILYVPLAALAYGLSNFRLGGHYGVVEAAGYRYFLPTLLFALVLVAVWTDRWMARGGRARIGALALFTATAIPCASSLAIPDWTFGSTGVGSKLDGYNLAQIARALSSARNAVPHDEIVARVQSMPPDVRANVVAALGFNLGIARAEKSVARGETLALDELLAPWPTSWHADFTRGLGHGLRFLTRARGAPIDAALEDARRVATQDGALRDALENGLARPGVALPMPWETESVLRENRDWLERRGRESRGFADGTWSTCASILERGVEADANAARMTELATKPWLAVENPEGR